MPANDGREVNFYIKPVKLGKHPVEVHIKSEDCSDALRKDLNVEVWNLELLFDTLKDISFYLKFQHVYTLFE